MSISQQPFSEDNDYKYNGTYLERTLKDYLPET